MQCPNCKEKYRFQDVPFEYRDMKFLITDFICPFCDVWITPGKAYKASLIAFVSLTVASLLFILLEGYFYPIFKWLGISIGLVSFFFLIVAKLVLKYEIRKHS